MLHWTGFVEVGHGFGVKEGKQILTIVKGKYSGNVFNNNGIFIDIIIHFVECNL